VHVANGGAVRDDLTKVIRFLDRPTEKLRLPLDVRGTPLQRRVWEKMRAIPFGTTVTYMELARWVAPLTSAHVIADACAANPIGLAIPCHRVVRTDGSAIIVGALHANTNRSGRRPWHDTPLLYRYLGLCGHIRRVAGGRL
jgi:O-6-methylguanine DNA methyltransferase